MEVKLLRPVTHWHKIWGKISTITKNSVNFGNWNLAYKGQFDLLFETLRHFSEWLNQLCATHCIVFGSLFSVKCRQKNVPL